MDRFTTSKLSNRLADALVGASVPTPVLKVGDRVVFNSNLDKSPDPENAKIVGVVLGFTKAGGTFGSEPVPEGMALVDWIPELPHPAPSLDQIQPINPDWLEIAPPELIAAKGGAS